MSNNGKVVLGLFFSAVVHTSFSMDEPPKKPEGSQTSNIYPQLTSSSNGLVSAHLSNSSSYQPWLSFNPFSAATGFLSSIATTAHNQLSDDAALKKIGYPRDDSYAQGELRECQQIYRDLVTIKDSDTRKILLERATRRTEYLTRIFCMLPDRSDARDIVLLCIEKHQEIMNGALSSMYPAFLHAQAQAYTVASDQVKKLTTLQKDNQNAQALIPSPVGIAQKALITIPTPSAVFDCLIDGANSLYETVKNEFSDYEAFKKLGWPVDDPIAQQELQKTAAVYSKVLHLDNRPELADTLDRICRRTKILMRAFLSLPSRTVDKCQFAAHCILHHRWAMFPLLLTLFENFIEEEKMAAQTASKNILKSSHLNIVSDGQAMLHFGKADEQPKSIQGKLGLANIILLKQVHGIVGCVIEENNRAMQDLSVEGDFLITDQRNIGLGIATADCLPIIFVDAKHGAVGIAHAGWRGSVGSNSDGNTIVKAVLDSMQQKYGTTVNDLSITFGPSAQKCCYKVTEDFLPHVDEKKFTFASETITKKDDGYFFDLLLFNKKLLLSLGVPENAIHEQFSKCTICNHEYNSYRRQGDVAGRQVSCVWVT